MSAASDSVLQEAADRLEREAPGYLQRVRRMAADRSLPATPAARMAQAIELVEEAARIDAGIPLFTSNRWVRLAKTGIGRFVRWYMLYVATQVSDLGGAVSWLGRATQQYVDGLESEVATLRSRIEELTIRLEQVEGTQGPTRR